MLHAAYLALAQMLSPPFRSVLLKSAGLALLLLAVLMVGLYQLVAWLGGAGGAWMETTLGPAAQNPLAVLGWILAIALGAGLFAGAVFLMPAVTSLVASFYADDVAAEVERVHYPDDPPGIAPPIGYAVLEGTKTALLALVIYLCAAPFLLVAGAGAVVFFLATAYLLGREYFLIAAVRLQPIRDAKAMWRDNRTRVVTGGLLIAAFVLIPIVNFATPLFATALMVHLHKRMAAERAAERRRERERIAADPNDFSVQPPDPRDRLARH
ncbi:sulfate transporter family protein [Rhodoplanes serenus]|uniref:Sulfate transporter family protein n=1 Tax=Rhodoplanes serenus TaxID=200615 RepID=A0A9X4XIL8_9BRAD|nr:sulfate transporter family protein [Rhodoplanes serenus]MTW15878.1 sulfate transporter family protein [Rhodoplanes serenus]